MKLKVCPLTIGLLRDFIAFAREKDIEECWHATHIPFESMEIREFANTSCLYDEETHDVYCIWGVEDKVIWMLCTYEVEMHPIGFLRFCKEYLKGLLETHPFMYNYVWLGNELHVKWLKWMGVTFGETKTINGEPFQYFKFEKKE